MYLDFDPSLSSAEKANAECQPAQNQSLSQMHEISYNAGLTDSKTNRIEKKMNYQTRPRVSPFPGQPPHHFYCSFECWTIIWGWISPGQCTLSGAL